MNEIRKLVSRDKYRYKDGNFDLDLTFITPRIIAMGLPGEKINSVWRNDIDDVADFFYSNFGDHFLIINLAETSYDYGKFGYRVVDMGFPDHNCPPLELLFQIIQTMDKFLQEDERNVVAVHCLAGRGRTGTVIAAYLLYSKQFPTAQEALSFFAQQRSKHNEGVIGPSQIRYVMYYQKVLEGFPYQPRRRMLLKQITITPVPAIEIGEKTRGSCTPALKIYSSGKLVYSSMERSAENFRREDYSDMNLEIGVLVSDDVQVKVYHRAKSKMKFAEIIGTCKLSAKEAVSALAKYPYIPLFRYTFNTAFIESLGIFTLTKRELDAPFQGVAKESIFPRNMTVTSFLLDQSMMSMSGLEVEPSPRSYEDNRKKTAFSQPQVTQRVPRRESSVYSTPSISDRRQEVMKWLDSDDSTSPEIYANGYSSRRSNVSTIPSADTIPSPLPIPVPAPVQYSPFQPLPSTSYAYPSPAPPPSQQPYYYSSPSPYNSQQQSYEPPKPSEGPVFVPLPSI